MVCARAGYPRDALPKGQIAPAFAGALDCCAMTRAAFEAAGGVGHGYALDGYKGADLFMKLNAAGVRILWAAGIELYALDDLQASCEHSAQVGFQVDGWCFKAAWQEKTLPQPVADRVADLSNVPRLRAAAAG
jgi:hypothetical protein